MTEIAAWRLSVPRFRPSQWALANKGDRMLSRDSRRVGYRPQRFAISCRKRYCPAGQGYESWVEHVPAVIDGCPTQQGRPRSGSVERRGGHPRHRRPVRRQDWLDQLGL